MRIVKADEFHSGSEIADLSVVVLEVVHGGAAKIAKKAPAFTCSRRVE